MQIQNNARRIITVQGNKIELVLTPGMNLVDEAEFAQLCESDSALAYLEALMKENPMANGMVMPVPTLQIHSKGLGLGGSLEGYNVDEAADLIKDTFDLDKLVAWSEDDRVTVRRAVERQLDLIAKAEREKDDEDDADGQ